MIQELVAIIVITIVLIISALSAIILMFLKPKSKTITGGAIEISISPEIEEIKQIISEKENTPIYCYEDIKRSLRYKSESDIEKTNTHIGQRKLLLNEIQFYSRHINRTEQTFVVYVGSASGEHTSIILDLFPNIKMILIDPALHYMNAEYKYIYQNLDTIPKDIVTQYHNLETPRADQRITKYIDQLKAIKFIGTATTYNSLNIVKNKPPDLVNEINKIKEKNKDMNVNIMDEIEARNERVFIIQDYATISLLTNIQKMLSSRNYPFVFVSDIRTTMFGKPTDFDIIWNNIQQIGFAKTMNTYSMLKFHPPYSCDNDVMDFIRDVREGKMKHMTIDRLKKYNNCRLKDTELVANYKFIIDDINTDYTIPDKIFDGCEYYYASGNIFLQPWGPAGTSETRLIVSPKDINSPYIKYNIKEWENKFYYLRFYRQVSFYPNLVDLIRKIEKDTSYNGCLDCSMEIRILAEYISRVNIASLKTYNDIEKLLEKSAVIEKIIEIRKKMDNILGMLNNCKQCRFHELFYERPITYYLYQLANNSRCINLYKISKGGLECIDYFNYGVSNRGISTYIFKDENKTPVKDIPYINNIKIQSKYLSMIIKKTLH